MIDKLIIDDMNIELSDKDKMPYTYNFSTAKTHIVKYALSDTNEISAGAFANCTYMTKIKFPPEIKMIKRRAFENCSRLNNVVIPKTIEYIGANVWDGCTSLTDLTFEATTPPSNASKVPENCKVYIPNGSKYVIEETLDLDNETYYEKTFYNVYKEVPKTMIDPTKQYYKDNWTSIADNMTTVELKDRIPVTDIVFEYSTTSINTKGEENKIVTIEYSLIPSNATNKTLHFVSSNTSTDAPVKIIDTEKEGEIVLECKANTTSETTFTVYSESNIQTTFKVSTTVA